MSSAPSALVIGAGVGGLCSAARLAGAGWDVTLLERLRHVGGRWSTREVEGFKLPSGAFLIAMDDPLADTFTDLGVEFPVRAIDERTAYLVNGEVVGTGTSGGLRSLIAAASEVDGSDVGTIMGAIRGALGGDNPATSEPLPGWLADRGAGPMVVDAIHSMCQAFMGINAAEVTAEAFFDYLTATAGRGKHGIPPDGSIRLAQNLADFVTSNDGTIRLGSSAKELIVETREGDPTVVGAKMRDGEEIRADAVISDVGVTGTADMLPPEAAEALPAVDDVLSAPGITNFIALEEPYFDSPAVVVTGTRCVCLVTTPTLVAPELAPEGWHYMETISTFESSTDDSDPKGEMQRHLEDVDDILPGWRDRGRLLQSATYRGSWPVYRSWPGTDPQERNPLPGLALVGDSVKPHGWPGTGASAESARLVVEELLAR
ncbi:MAG: phytoene desaturase family protein [Microthrixaceae bacterium]